MSDEITISSEKLESIVLFLGELHCLYDILHIEKKRAECLESLYVHVKNTYVGHKMRNNER